MSHKFKWLSILISFFLFLCCLGVFDAWADEENDMVIKVTHGEISGPPNTSTGDSIAQEVIDINKENSATNDNSGKKPVSTGKSISNSNGKKISNAAFKDKPEKMITVYNLGKPEGIDTKPQPVSKIIQDIQSDELNKLEEKRLKRKANFSEKLNKRKARKDFVKRRKARGIIVEDVGDYSGEAVSETKTGEMDQAAIPELTPAEKRKKREESFQEFLKEYDAQNPEFVEGIRFKDQFSDNNR